MKRRNPLAVWVLPWITFGIYHLVWYFRIHKELGRYDPREPISPGVSLCAVMFGWIVVVPPFISYYNAGRRIATAQRAAGLPPTCNGGIGLALMVLLFGFGAFYYQDELNKVADRWPQVAADAPIMLAN